MPSLSQSTLAIKVARVFNGYRRLVSRVGARSSAVEKTRLKLARSFLRGNGIEIGALHRPLRVGRRTRVRYVDRFTCVDLRRHYPELNYHPLVPVDVIDNAELLSTFKPATVDFVIANHVLEHCEDPLTALEHWGRVLVPEGVLYLSVPDKRFTFDRDRPITALEHVIADHMNGAHTSRRQHYLEWARDVSRVPAHQIETKAAELQHMQYSIHFHVWDPPALVTLVNYWLHNSALALKLDLCVQNSDEIITIIRKHR